MKTLIISNYFPPEMGAASNRIFQMAKSFANSNEGIEVACPFPNYPTGVIFPGYKGFYKLQNVSDIKVHRFYIYANNSVSYLLRGFSMISFALSLWLMLFKKSMRYERVIIQNSPLLVSFSSIILFKFFLKSKVILNVSDLWPGSAVDLGVIKKGSLTHKVLLMIESFNYNNSDKIIGQSKLIIEHINKLTNKPTFIYRNLPVNDLFKVKSEKRKIKTFIYAGLLGVAQGVLSIVKIMSLTKNDFEFHIYGDGPEKNSIIHYLQVEQIKNIKYFGSIPKLELQKILSSYYFAIVPLANDIKGAFPSKIYELILNRVPIIYIGCGEAKEVIELNGLGFVVSPNNKESFIKVINKSINLANEKYINIIKNQIHYGITNINYNFQFNKLKAFLDE